ncbi:hypothetical protein HHI36_010751 [Cryptolaemus montrouzieri]|uniref:Protein THEM6 n=1 Tax=Cryptolaemus montrouzieri TaxID=559131 RepID=A0ABD2MJP9_9CUCU
MNSFTSNENITKGICLTTDIDTLLTHMNNSRFLRELDFAKIDFFERTGLFRLLRKYNGTIAVGATTVRYRRLIKLFQLYKIRSKIIYWDNLSIYIEHRFIASSDDFVSAIVLCRTRIKNCDVEAMMAEALEVPEGGDIEHAKREKPEKSLVLQKWIEHNEISSAMLRSTETTVANDDGAKGNGHTNFHKEMNGNSTSKEAIDQTKSSVVEDIGCTNPTFNE